MNGQKKHKNGYDPDTVTKIFIDVAAIIIPAGEPKKRIRQIQHNRINHQGNCAPVNHTE